MDYKKILKLIGAALAVYLCFKYILPLVAPFVLALLIAVCIEKPVSFFEKRGIKRWISAACIVIISLAIMGIIVFFTGRYISVQMSRLRSEYGAEWEKYSGKLLEFGRKDAAKLLGNVLPAINICAKALAVLVVTLIAAVLISTSLPGIKQYVREREEWTVLEKMYQKTCGVGAAYIRAQLILMSITAGICCIGLVIVRNPYWLIMGLIVGLLDALPFIGCGVILVPIAIVFLIRKSYIKALCIGITFVICYIIRQVLEPKLMGDGLGVRPLEILFSVYVGIKLWGIAGFILGPIGYILVKEIVFYI